MLKNAYVAFVKEHLAYREEQARLFASLHFTHDFSFSTSFSLRADEERELLAIGCSDMNNPKNPTVLPYSALTSYELWRLKKKLDDSTMSGDTYSSTMTSAIGALLGTSASKNSDYFNIRLTTTDKYWAKIDIETPIPNGINHKGYENNMSGACHLIKCIVRKEPFVIKM